MELPFSSCAVGPSFRFEDKAGNLDLAKIWDARGLLGLCHEKPRFLCRVFNAHKNDLIDRLIGDRRWWNQHEMHFSGPSTFLPNGQMVCSLHCPRGSVLRGCVSDRTDFYHQCAASRARTQANCLPFAFNKEHFASSAAYDELIRILNEPTCRSVHGDRYGMKPRKRVKEHEVTEVYAGFKSLFQGDHLGVEYALSAHMTMTAL